ncbi:hypothetical protein OK074_0626 [Actinobacteria bacterium OK074]|nr:hypothetical protein OK074_0626 [Actinobacteria bacterium OK074]
MAERDLWLATALDTRNAAERGVLELAGALVGRLSGVGTGEGG